MELLMFLILAGCAARCDDSSNSYYVIEMPEDPPPREVRKSFKVYWNVPTMQCRSKRIPFLNLYEKYGIIQNKGDSFRGEKIAILYDPGLFPALLKNESSGKLIFRNGGVPQEGDLEKHISAFKAVLDQSIPDPGFNGIGIIDFESWRPVFRQNFGVLVPYKDVSYEIERKIHWWWPKHWIQAEAKKRFEEAARTFMQTTISVAKQMRPNAVWGYYGFPYCFNVANNNMQENCAKKVTEENDGTYWLWAESGALFPSVYSPRALEARQLAALVRGRVLEAARVARETGTPAHHALVLPYFWFRYRDGGFMSELDLDTALDTLYKSNASGFIIWGSSNDVNTVEKCLKLHDYVENIMGPAIAKYTKQINKLEEDINNITTVDTFSPNKTNDNATTTNKPFEDVEVTTKVQNVLPDPEFHWSPPENYTQDIVQYVEEELMKKADFNTSFKKKVNETVLNKINDSVLIDAILSHLFDIIKKTENEKDKKGPPKLIKDLLKSAQSFESTVTTTEYDIETSTFTEQYLDLETSTNSKKFTTKNPLTNVSKNKKKGDPLHRHGTKTYSKSTKNPNDSREYNASVKDSYSQESTETVPYTTDTPTDQTSQFYNEDEFISFEDDSILNSDTVSTEFLVTEEARTEFKPSKNKKKGSHKEKNPIKDSEDIEVSTLHNYEDVTEQNANVTEYEEVIQDVITKNRKKGVPRRRNEERETKLTSLNLSTSPPRDQVTGSAPHSVFGHKYFICIIFYFYSVSKCLCDIYGRCY